MAVKFVCGFECGTLARGAAGGHAAHWINTVGTPTIVTSGPSPMRSPKCVKIDHTAAVGHNLTATFQTAIGGAGGAAMVARFYVYWDTLPVGSVTQPLFVDPVTLMGVYYYGSLGTMAAGGSGGGAGGVTPVTGQWYLIDCRILRHTSINGVSLNIDEVSQTGYSTSPSAAAISGFSIGRTGAIANCGVFYMDDLIVTEDPFPIGPGKTVGLFVNGDRTNTSASPSHDGIGHRWDAVTDFGKGSGGATNTGAQNAESTMYQNLASTIQASTNPTNKVANRAGASTELVAFKFPTLPAPAVTVDGLMVVWSTLGSSATSCTAGVRLIVTPGASEEVTVAGTTTIATASSIIYSAPGLQARSVADVNAITAHWGQSSDVNPDPYLIGMMLEVAYKEALGTSAPAEHASATGAAYQPTALTTRTAGHASATASAFNATVLTGTGAPAGHASATATAHAPVATATRTAGHAAATATAHAPLAQVKANAGHASATATAHQPSVTAVPAVSAPAGHASATAEAFDATVTAVGNVQAFAGHASATAAAFDASGAIGARAGHAAATGIARTPVATPAYAFATLVEDFEDTLTNPPWANTSSPDFSLDAGRGRLRIIYEYPGFWSRNQFYINDSSIHAEIETPPGTDDLYDFYFSIFTTISPQRSMGFARTGYGQPPGSDNLMVFATGSSDVIIGPYDHTAHRWLRWREASGTLYYETSPDGATWTVVHSQSTPTEVAGRALAFRATAGYRGGLLSPDQYIYVDNINVPQAVALAGHASATAEAFDATVATSAGTNAPAEHAAATATAHDPTATTTRTAGHASATAAAFAPTVRKVDGVGHASATGQAFQPSTQVRANAGHASASATAHQPSASRVDGVGHAAATGQAFQPSTAVRANAGHASATATAHQPSISTLSNTYAPAGHASATAQAFQPTLTLTSRASAGHASATAAALDPDAAIRPTAGHATATGAAGAAQAGLRGSAGHAAATGTAFQPTVAISGATNAPAGHAAATAAAHAPSTQVRAFAGHAAATAEAFNPSTSVVTNVNAPAGHAAATAQAFNVTAAKGEAAEAQHASATASAFNATVRIGAAPGHASATAQAHTTAAAIQVAAQLATAVAQAYPVAAVLATMALAGHAGATAQAFNVATLTVVPDSLAGVVVSDGGGPGVAVGSRGGAAGVAVGADPPRGAGVTVGSGR